MLTPVNYGAILATIVCFALFLWNFAAMIAQWLHWPAWTRLAMILSMIGAAIVAKLIAILRDEIRTRRERREHAEMEQRYPQCHVTRLASGKWFLTDRSTGREYRPGIELP